MQKVVAILVLLSLVVTQCQRLFNVASRFPPCGDTVWNQADVNAGGASCSGLAELLAVVNSSLQAGDEVVINLERGNEHHYLTRVVHITANASITIKVNISGEYSVRLENNYAVTLQGIEFIGCPRIIRVLEVFNVSITDCMFREFTEGALIVADCTMVYTNGVVFKDSTVIGSRVRGNAAGLTISYEYGSPFRQISPHFDVINCTFTNLSSLSTVATVSFLSFLVQNMRLAGTGGGMAIFLIDNIGVTGIVSGCKFRDNFAAYFGAGLAVVGGKSVPPLHHVAITDCEFTNNRAGFAGGGVYFTFVGYENIEPLLNVTLYNCVFSRNKAQAGAGIFDAPSVGSASVLKVTISNSTFRRNSASEFGGGYAVVSFTQGFITTLFNSGYPRIISDCTFIETPLSRGGVVSLLYYPVLFSGTNKFLDNSGPSIRVVGTIMGVNGSVEFTDNSAVQLDGGALYSTSFGQVQLYRGSHLNFTKNRGNIGASIVVESQRVPQIFQQLMNNPLCFLLYEEQQSTPDEWSGVSMSFNENTADVGPVAYIDKLNLCSWSSYQSPYFRIDSVLKWQFVELRKNTNRGRGTSNTNQDYYVQTPSVSFNSDLQCQKYFPGEPVRVTLEAFDELRHFTTEFFRFTDNQISQTNVLMALAAMRGRGSGSSSNNNNNNNGDSNSDNNNDPPPPPLNDNDCDALAPSGPYLMDTSPSLIVSDPQSKNYEIRYRLKRDTTIPNEAGQTSDTIIPDYADFEGMLSIDSPTELALMERLVGIESKRCPPGFILKGQSGVWACECNDELDELVECLPRTGLHVLEGYWASISSDSNGVAFHYCPPSYCRCARLEESDDPTCYSILPEDDIDKQCVCDRKGVLCGECRDGKGVSALLNRCVDCDDVSALLIVALIVLDAAAVLILLRLNYRFPTWLYPCLFYIQMTPYITDDFPVTFNKAHRYLYYISSLTSLYFPYDFCLYNGITALESFAIRFVPFFVTVTIIATIVVARRFIRKLKQYQFRHGIWFLIVLQSSHVLHTSMSLLNCPNVSFNVVSSSSTQSLDSIVEETRWYWDGSVRCFNGGHVPLGLLSIFIIIFGLLLIIIVTVSHVIVIKEPYYLANFLRVCSVPSCVGFKAHCSWWGGVELGRRLVLLIFVIAFGRNEIPALFILMIIFALYCFVCPYKDVVICLGESLMCVTLMLIILLRNTTYMLDQLLVLVNDSSELVVDGSCDLDSTGVTKLTALLTPFYYLLLLVALCFVTVKFPWTKSRLMLYSLYGQFKAAPVVVISEEVEMKPHTVTEVAIGQDDGEILVNTTVVLQ